MLYFTEGIWHRVMRLCVFDEMFWLLYIFYQKTGRFLNPLSEHKTLLNLQTQMLLFWAGTTVFYCFCLNLKLELRTVLFYP